MRATKSYREVHEALAASLRAQGVPAVTQETRDPAADTPAGVCFERAEVHDVIHSGTGAKIAGAAQKRNKRGLLFQGSLWRPAAESGGPVDWDRFTEDFTAALAVLLGAAAGPAPWPEFAEGEVEASELVGAHRLYLDGKPLLHFSTGVDVVVWPMESLGGGGRATGATGRQAAGMPPTAPRG